MGSVVYLTGVPGTGKTTVAGGLAASGLSLAQFSYSDRLAIHLGATREELREQSASVVAASAVWAVDQELGEFIAERRSSQSVLIDSHAVTYEKYGYRVIPFTASTLVNLRLDAVVCLTAPSAIILARIGAAPEGRRPVSLDAIEQAQRLQEAVAVGYALSLGVPLYIVDAGQQVEDTVGYVSSILARLLDSP